MQTGEEVGGGVRSTLLVFLSLAAAACGMTLLFLGMRAVMDVGGACADGGPYVSAQPCPEGVPAVVLLGLWGGLIASAVYAWQVLGKGIPGLVGLLWPALFLSLGWNFLEFGLDPPGEGTGIAPGWLVCAALFAVMGGLPLVWTLPATLRGLFRSEPVTRPAPVRVRAALRATIPTVRRRDRGTATMTSAPDAETGDVVDRLERLDRLHRSGALDAEEYDEAKRRVLEGEGP